MFGFVIRGKSAWMVDKDCPCAFEYKGAYYVWDKNYQKAFEYLINKYF